MSTAEVVAPLRVRTHPVDDAASAAVPGEPSDLLGRLPAEGALAWVRGGEGFVGWGEAARVELTGPDRFTAAEQWWSGLLAGLDVDDPLGLPGTGPVAFASF